MSSSTLALALLLAGAPASAEAEPASSPSAAPVLTLPVLPAAEPAAIPAAQPGEPVPAPVPTAAPDSTPVETPVRPPILTIEGVEGEPDQTIEVIGSRRKIAADPLSGINAVSFEAIQLVDKAVVGPTASVYKKVVPTPVRNGLRNFLSNLAEPVVFVNYLLQLKPGKAAETAGRFAVNSTVGVAGLFDMAKRKPFKLPYRPNGFANTMACYGIGNGPFLFVPLLGPTTVRDFVGRVLDLGMLPAVAGDPFDSPAYSLTSGIVKSMNDRVKFDAELKKIRESADPYVASRDLYFQRRQQEIDGLRCWASRKTPPGAAGNPATAPVAAGMSQPATPATEPEVAPAPTLPVLPAPAAAAPAQPTPAP